MAKNKFYGADDIYLTAKNIAITHVKSIKDKQGNWRTLTKTTYVPKTKGNLNEARRVYGYIRKGR